MTPLPLVLSPVEAACRRARWLVRGAGEWVAFVLALAAPRRW
jgi:hypothetical protein